MIGYSLASCIEYSYILSASVALCTALYKFEYYYYYYLFTLGSKDTEG